MSVHEMSPAERKFRRNGIRKQLAAIELIRRRCRELRQQIEAIDANTDHAVAQHRAGIAPLREELDSIATQQVEEISAGREPGAALEKQRKKLLAERDQLNLVLEETTQRNTALLKPLQQDLRGLEKETVNYLPLQNEIAQHADEDDLDRAWLWEQKLNWLRARSKEGRRRLAELQSTQAVEKEKQWHDKELLAVLVRRIRRWKLEGEDVNRDIAATMEQQELLRKRLLEREE